MLIDFEGMDPKDAYHILTQTVIPRPVAWVLSENPDGDFNLAPFSFFTPITSNPPLLMISVGKKPTEGVFKDTRVNIEARSSSSFISRTGISPRQSLNPHARCPMASPS